MSDPKHDVIPRAEILPVGNERVLHPAVSRILEKDPTPETLREILALQREWEASEAKRSYTRALVALKSDLPPWIERDTLVDFQSSKGRVRYSHVSLAGAMQVVTPALNAHGFSISWSPANTPDGKVSVTATLKHRDGHQESATLSAPPDAGGLKSAAQSIASTVTLLQRYTALSLLGLATADMEEDKPEGSTAAPAGEEAVDSSRNIRAMRDIAKAGKSKEEAEKFVGRPLPQWNTQDLAKLRTWITPAPAPAREIPAMDPSEPGEDAEEKAPAPKGRPANPQAGDEWDEVVQVVSISPAKKGAHGEFHSLQLRHSGGQVTEHASWHKSVAELALKYVGKDELLKVHFSAKLGRDKTTLYVNVESMELAPSEDIPF